MSRHRADRPAGRGLLLKTNIRARLPGLGRQWETLPYSEGSRKQRIVLPQAQRGLRPEAEDVYVRVEESPEPCLALLPTDSSSPSVSGRNTL